MRDTWLSYTWQGLFGVGISPRNGYELYISHDDDFRKDEWMEGMLGDS
jgi:hypothetical protein